MTFTFNDITFRIVFRHERSRRWSDHVGHQVEIVSGMARFADAKIVISCQTCSGLIIGNIPKGSRQRKTWCSIQRPVKGPAAPYWQYVVSAAGKPNEDAGDRFNRAEGRIHSLTNALAARVPEILPGITTLEYGLLPKEFREAAWKAFHERKPWTIDIQTGPPLVAGSEAWLERATTLLAEEHAQPNGWWYLSFAGDVDGKDTFLGVVIVEAHGMTDAVMKSHCLKINPGGQVLALKVPPDRCPPPAEAVNRLMIDKMEIERLCGDAGSMVDIPDGLGCVLSEESNPAKIDLGPEVQNAARK